MMDNKLTVDDLKIPYNKNNLDKNDVNRAMFHNIEKIKKETCRWKPNYCCLKVLLIWLGH